jgi:hypothetical protein
MKHLYFEIDKLTNSIENAFTGEVFETSVALVTRESARQLKKSDWVFDWQKELKNEAREVYKLTTEHNNAIIHGLLSITDKKDHIFMDLIESAKFNKGKKKQYNGVPGNLVAFACKISFERKYSGYVSFLAKTQLIEHYQNTLGAQLFSGNRMFIGEKESVRLVNRYFKNFNYGEL